MSFNEEESKKVMETMIKGMDEYFYSIKKNLFLPVNRRIAVLLLISGLVMFNLFIPAFNPGFQSSAYIRTSSIQNSDPLLENQNFQAWRPNEMIKKASPSAAASRSGNYPQWLLGDYFNYTQTYHNPNYYNSYSMTSSYEVKNITTETTPAGTFNVFGVSGTSSAFWTGNPPHTSGSYQMQSSNYYAAGNLSSVSSYTYTDASTYYSTSNMYYSPPQDIWDYPIGADEQWNVSTTYYYDTVTVMKGSGDVYPNSGSYTYTSEYDCRGRTTVNVEAGSFTVLEIIVSSDPTSYSKIYFDPQMGWHVKMESYSQGVLHSIIELNHTNFQPGPAVNSQNFDISMLEDTTYTSLNCSDIFTSEKELSFNSSSSAKLDVIIGQGGGVTIRPQNNWFGEAALTLEATDGTKSVSKEIMVTVNPVNDAPYLTGFDSVELSEGGSITGIDLFEHAHDVDDPNDDIIFDVGQGTQITTDLRQGHLLDISSQQQWYGRDSFGITLSDGDKSKDYSISVTVTKRNDPPVLEALDDMEVPQYDHLNFTLEAEDPDFEESLTFNTNISDSIEEEYYGELFQFDSYTGLFSFHPVREELVGVHYVSFWVSDGTVSDYENITITVENVNDPPVVEGGIIFERNLEMDSLNDGGLTYIFHPPDVFDQDGDQIDYLWNFGDGSNGNPEKQCNHTFMESGNYTVTLSISDGHISDSIIVEAEIEINIYDDDPDSDTSSSSDDNTSSGGGNETSGTDSQTDDDDKGDDSGDNTGDTSGEGSELGSGKDNDDDSEDLNPNKNSQGTESSGISGAIIFLIIIIVIILLAVLAVLIILIMRKSGGEEEQDAQNDFKPQDTMMESPERFQYSDMNEYGGQPIYETSYERLYGTPSSRTELPVHLPQLPEPAEGQEYNYPHDDYTYYGPENEDYPY